MHAVVVDTEETAAQCITILHEKRATRETFLPMNTLDVKTVKAELRNIAPNVHVSLG